MEREGERATKTVETRARSVEDRSRQKHLTDANFVGLR